MSQTLRELLGDGYLQGSVAPQYKKASGASNSQAGDGEGGNFEDSEISVLLEFVEENYKSLYGHGTGSEYKAKKDKMWKKLVEVVNKVYKGSKNRTKSQIYNKVDNFRSMTKKHLRAWVKHKTGGGPAPAALTDIDQIILRIFGSTPAFKGILDMTFDTPIEVDQDCGTESDAKWCGTKLTKNTSAMAKALSSNEVLDVNDILEEAVEIRNLRKQIEENNEVAVEPVIKFEQPGDVSENAATANNTVAAIPSSSGVVIVLDAEPTTSTGKGRGKKRRVQDQDVVIVQEKKPAGKVSIPNYLQEDPPSTLKLLNLRKHALISQTERNYAEKLWYDQSRALFPHLKRMIASMPFGKGGAQSDKNSDHVFAFPSNNSDSDCDV